MKTLYPWLSNLAALPLAGYSLLKPDLRGNVVRRFWPKLEIQNQKGRRIWIHAASAGEVRLADLFARSLRTENADVSLLLTTNTDSGLRVATSGAFDVSAHFPFDVHHSLARIFSAFKPELIVLVEKELWPGLIGMAKKAGVPVLVINAGITTQALGRYENLNARFDGILTYPHYLLRSDRDLANLLKLGIAVEHTDITGEMKIDLIAEQVDRRRMPQPHRPTLLAVSTHQGEEAILLEAFGALRDDYPDARLVLAPRHGHRVPAVLQQVMRQGFAAAPIEDNDLLDLDWADVLVEDRFGRMAMLYAASTAAFIGGSFSDHGGHNVLEPVMAGLPVLVGPKTEKWADWVGFLDESGAASVVQHSGDIARIFGIVVEEAEEVMRVVVSARARLEQQLGTARRNAQLALEILSGG